jgi:tetraacyldisaccharide 4'-kinase
LLVVGEGDAADGVAARLHAQSRPVFHARLVPDKAAVSALSGQNVLAFAGIGDPDKFFATARTAGVIVSRRRTFPDHHRYTPQDASELILRAEHSGLTLLTTEKDRARMAGDPRLAGLAASVQTLPVTMVVQEAGELRRLIKAKLPR